MADQATARTRLDPGEFLAAVPDQRRREDAIALCELIREATGQQPAMWGPAIVGFGEYSYRYASGRSGTYLATGFSPRKQHLVLYLMDGYEHPQRVADLAALGPHSVGKSCLYLKRLGDVDLDVLRRMIAQSYAETVARDAP
ncbi:MAG TPA: DUF1801 domain-containing protein [Actinomycetes bacterium]|nr:DUF1801 domain-containing protein [Actinomycetes bacterium]